MFKAMMAIKQAGGEGGREAPARVRAMASAMANGGRGLVLAEMNYFVACIGIV